MKLFRLMLVGAGTVSYTHLDVYKRQKIRCSQVSLFSVVCYTYLNIIGSVLLFLMGVNLRFKCCHNFCRIFVELFTAKVPHLCGLCGNTITTKICHFVPPMGIEPIFSVQETDVLSVELQGLMQICTNFQRTIAYHSKDRLG